VANCEQVDVPKTGGPAPGPGTPTKACRPGKVKGLTLGRAKAKAKRGHCKVKVARKPSAKVRRGRVVKAVVHGRTATLVVSRGARRH
jgi:hypothetical protein